MTKLKEPGKQTVIVEEVKEEVKDNGEEIKQTSSNMIHVLENSDNPKLRNSKFLKFLKKLSHGAYKIENEQLTKVPEKIQEFKVLEQGRLEEEAKRMVQEEEIKAMQGYENPGQQSQDIFKKMWEQEGEVTDDQCKIYNQLKLCS